MFESDASLFFEAEIYLQEAVKKFETTEKVINTIKEQMSEMDYNASYFSNNKNKIDNVKKKLDSLVENIAGTRKRLQEIETFNDEYSDLLSSYSIKDVSQSNASIFDLSSTELDFNELTDLQYNRLSLVTYYFSNRVDIFIENKGNKLSDIEPLLGTSDNGIKTFSNNGLGDFVIYDVVTDNYDNALMLVLKDAKDNYTLVFPCTSSPSELKETDRNLLQQYEDAVYDGLVFFNTDLFGIKAIEQNAASLAAGYYYQRAYEEEVKINFLGYSKGGGVAEHAYVKIASLPSVDQDVLGEIIVYNPLHDNLTDSEIKILKESGDFTVYRNQGDLISTYNHENTFDDQTIFIRCDWTSDAVYKLGEEEKMSVGARHGLAILGADAAMMAKNLDTVKNYAFNGGAHGLDAYGSESLAFDNYGNSIYNPQSYLYTESGKYTGREVYMYLFGVEDIRFWKDD